MRPLIVSVFQPSSRCENAAVISVRTYPGLIVLTRMPYTINTYSMNEGGKEWHTYSVKSFAMAGHIARTAPFEPQYAEHSWLRTATWLAMLATRIILPCFVPLAIICFAACCAVKYSPSTLTASRSWCSSYEKSRKWWWRLIPAQGTQMSSLLPKSVWNWAKPLSRALGEETSTLDRCSLLASFCFCIEEWRISWRSTCSRPSARYTPSRWHQTQPGAR